MVEEMPSHSHHTTEACLPRVREYVKYYAKFRTLVRSSKYDSERAAVVEKQAGSILYYLRNWGRNDRRVTPAQQGYTRLVRTVRTLETVETMKEKEGTGRREMSFLGKYSSPEYVLPLGRLYQTKKQTQQLMELDEVVVMDIENSTKALWRVRCSKERVHCCYSLEMLVADIKELGSPNAKVPDGGQDGRGNNRHSQSDAATASASQAANGLAERYSDSRVEFAPGALVFTEMSKDSDFLDYIRRLWESAFSKDKTPKYRLAFQLDRCSGRTARRHRSPMKKVKPRREL